MKARIIILPDGQVSAFTDEGSFDAGKAKIEALWQTLRASGLDFSEVGQVEQHKHDHQHVHQHAQE